MTNLRLERPIVFFDLETTGTDPATDRIVEISVLRVETDGSRTSRTRRINPERKIPAEASAVHGIRNEDVADEPTFGQIARGLLDFLTGADLAGFNLVRFDVPLLDREFRDCGLDLGLSDRQVVDVMTVFHRKERRDLAAAVEFYLGRAHEAAHSAESDVAVTVEVLEAQLERYDDLPHDVAGLAEWCNPAPADAVDRAGKFVWRNGQAVVGFGRLRGRPLEDVARTERDYLEWIIRSDFPADAKEIVARALKGQFPRP